MPLAELADRLWYGESPLARVAGAALAPASVLYGAIIARRNRAADQHPPAPGPIPSVSVGNLTVGGTGKTPVSAWLARRLYEAGANPAIVLRGYGDDEPLVHALLNPEIPVLTGAERADVVREAARAGAECAVLDDAFQHRRAHRVADLVLVSADRWTGRVRLLPAGPFREPLDSLRRATVVALTVKAAAPDQIAAAEAALRRATGAPLVTLDLRPASFVSVADGASEPVERWRGRRVLLVSGIGDPLALERQMKQLGLLSTPLSFADHQSYDAATVQRIVAASRGCDAVLCTLKDAVKLRPIWPGDTVPLWYVSQSVIPRDGAEALDELVRSVLQARRSARSLPDLSR